MTSAVMGSGGSDDGNDPDGRKGFGKRELSTSKRAAQNRAAQVSQHNPPTTNHAVPVLPFSATLRAFTTVA